MSEEKNEETPLASGHPVSQPKQAIAALACTVIPLSVGLINLNKWLMRADRFPHAIPLVTIHMIICTIMALILRVMMPSLFPALTDPDTRIEVDLNFFLKGAMPIGLVFASSLVLGNIAYAHIGVAFIQMIKESNLIWVYILCVACAMEKYTKLKSAVVAVAIVGMSFTVRGELHFEIIGFVVQLAAVLSEACRLILQGILLQGKKLDPLSYILLTSPCCATILFIAMAVIRAIPNVGDDLALPAMSEIREWSPWLVGSALLAFCLNVSIAVFIKYTGPLSYCMVGILKDITAVIVSVVVLHETISHMQTVGFAIQIFCVLAWALLKSMPAHMDLRQLANFKEASSDATQPTKV